jgi:ribosomal protein S18 acetylase RimI-like enzyme
MSASIEGMDKKIFQIESESDLQRAFVCLRDLRPHLSDLELTEIYRMACERDSYGFVVMELQGEVVALLGYRILYDFIRGKHLYIDDLITVEKHRSRGFGADLLKYAEGLARGLDCKSLRLCTGIENEAAIRFYERNGWRKKAYAFTKRAGNATPVVRGPSVRA